jgi:YD repeat-containing protein
MRGASASCRIGNPCDPATGTKFQVETVDRSTSSPLVEQLSYNSWLLSDADKISRGLYGKGWRGTYERFIAEYSNAATAQRADGKELSFRKPPTGNIYLSDADVADRLERLVNGSGVTTGWKFIAAADDSTELYGANGKLTSIADQAGSTVTLGYSTASTPPSIAPQAGLLISVSDPRGRALSFIYDSKQRIVRVTDPASGNYDYVYDSAGNIASITFPDGKVRQYKYNEPAHTQNTALPNSLTGIIDENGARFATFEYDTQGRAVSTEHAGGAQKYTLEYTTPGVSTTVTGSGRCSDLWIYDLAWCDQGYGHQRLRMSQLWSGCTDPRCKRQHLEPYRLEQQPNQLLV